MVCSIPVRCIHCPAERYINVGTEDFPFHPHANNGLTIGRDGNALEGPGGQDISYEKFSFNIGPGQKPGISSSNGMTPRTTAHQIRCGAS